MGFGLDGVRRKDYKCHANTLSLFYLKYLEYIQMQIKYIFQTYS